MSSITEAMSEMLTPDIATGKAKFRRNVPVKKVRKENTSRATGIIMGS